MAKYPADKHCPRCGAAFVCHEENPVICQCYGIQLSDRARMFISAHYSDCLCRACLITINNEV